MKNHEPVFARNLTGRELQLDPAGLAAGWLNSQRSTSEQLALAIAISLCLHVMLVSLAGLRAPRLDDQISQLYEPFVIFEPPPEVETMPKEKDRPAVSPPAEPAVPPVIALFLRPLPEPTPLPQPVSPPAPVPGLPPLPDFSGSLPNPNKGIPGEGGLPDQTGGGSSGISGQTQPQPTVWDSKGETGFFPDPPYPPESKRAGEMGLVKLGWQVTAEGTIADVKVLTSSGHSRLDRAALETVQQRWLHSAGRVRSYTCEFQFKPRR